MTSDLVSENNFQKASKEKRFVNSFIDSIGIIFLLFLHAMVLDGLLGIVPDDGSPLLGIYSLVLIVFYHALFEYFFSKTPGKFLTKTHVVTTNGQRPTFSNILGRSLCRLIPFDNLSFLFSENGWHDKISNTMVVCD